MDKSSSRKSYFQDWPSVGALAARGGRIVSSQIFFARSWRRLEWGGSAGRLEVSGFAHEASAYVHESGCPLPLFLRILYRSSPGPMKGPAKMHRHSEIGLGKLWTHRTPNHQRARNLNRHSPGRRMNGSRMSSFCWRPH